MSDETKRAHLKLTGGPALIPAAAAAAEHFAEEAGLDEQSRAALVEACEQVCGDAFDHVAGSNGPLEVILDKLPDRIEISITHPSSGGPAIGLDAFIGGGSGGQGSKATAAGAALLTRVDRVRYETAGQISRMILVKYLPGAKKRAN